MKAIKYTAVLMAFLVPVIALAQVIFPNRGGTGISTAPGMDTILTGNGSTFDLRKLIAGNNIIVATTSTSTTISATGGGASSTIIKIGGVISNTGVPTIDFGSGITISESPADQFNISVSASATSSNEWDLFIIAGQSNAVASAGVIASTTVAPPGIIKSYYNGVIKEVTNDLDPGNGGPWPGFGLRYYQLTGRKVAFVHTAVGGTGMTATSSGGTSDNWGPDGYLYASSSQATRDAIAAYEATGMTVTVKGVLWSQGENDAAYIRALDETHDQYRDALTGLIARYRTEFGTSTPFYIFRTGSHVTAPATGYVVVRQVQENVAAADPNTYIVFRDSIDYVRRGMMSDDVHYDQSGYNDMGRIGAEGVVMAKTEPHWWAVSNALIYNTVGSTSPRLLVGDIGTASSTWASSTFAFDVYGNMRLSGALADSANATGTNGQVLSSTATSTRWVDRITTFLGLSDTPSSFTANRIPYTNSAATALTDSANFIFNGTNLGIGGVATPTASIQINGNTAIRPSIFEDGNLGLATDFNTFIMLDADNNASNNYVSFGRNASTTGEILGTNLEFARFYDTGRLSIGSTTIFGAMLQVQGTSTAPLMDINTSGLVTGLHVTSAGNVGVGTTTPSSKLSIAGDVSATGTVYISNGAVGTPSVAFTSDTDTGIYAAGTNSLGFAAGGAGMQWNGSALLPNSVNRSIGSDSNPWQNVYVGRNTSGNWRMSTSSLIAGTLLFTNSGYPSVTVGADTASAIANFQVNGASMGPYTSLGVINDGGNGVMVFDGTNSIGGLSNNLLLKNSNGPSGLQIPMTGGNGNAILRSYNGLGAIFNVLAPYHVSGTEANLSTSIVNSDGTTNTLDVGVQDYGGSYPTGRQMYMHTLASGLTTPMPTWSFGFWQQGYGDTSNSTSSWGWLAASSTGNTLDSTTVVAIGDAWSKGYSKGSGTIDFGPKNVTDYANGATVQVVASSSRTKALEVFSRNGNTLTSLFSVATTGASTTALRIAGLSNGCLNITSGLVDSTGVDCGSGGGSGSSTWSVSGGTQYPSGGEYIVVPYLQATTTATSTFAGGINIGSATTTSLLSVANTGSINSLIIEDQASDPTPFRIDSAGAITTGGTITVGGNVNAYHGGTPGSGLFSFFQSDGSTGAYWGAINSTFQRLGIDGSPIVLNGRSGSTGNVGIGTSTTPTYKLQVTGQGSTNPFGVASSSGDVIFNVNGNGNVGVGTTSPSARLTVSGDMRLTGRLADSASSTGSLGNVLTATANGTSWLATSSLGLSPLFTTSAALAALLSDETGTGPAVFGTSATFTGTTTLDVISTGVATMTANSAAAAATTTVLNIYDPTNSNAWSTVNPWGSIRWATADTGMPAKDYFRMGPIMDTVAGNNARFGFFHQVNSGQPIEVLTVGGATGDMGVASSTPGARLSVENITSRPSFLVTDVANDTTPFIIDNAGNVGIGSTTPGTLLSVAGAAQITGTTTVGGLSIGSLSGFLKSVAGAVVTALVNLATDVTGVLPIANGGTATTTPKVWSTVIASTSPAFISSGLQPVPLQGDGYTIARIACTVEGGTSKVIAIEDASGNSSEDITCGTSASFDDGSITNATYIGWEKQFIDFGATSGAVDYVTITVFRN